AVVAPGDAVRGDVGVRADGRRHARLALVRDARPVRLHPALALADLVPPEGGHRPPPAADACRGIRHEQEWEMTVPQQPTWRTAGEGRTIAVVGDVYRFLATGEDTDGKYALWEAFVPPGGGPPPHVHSREEEGFYVLEGEITFVVGDRRHVAT